MLKEEVILVLFFAHTQAAADVATTTDWEGRKGGRESETHGTKPDKEAGAKILQPLILGARILNLLCSKTGFVKLAPVAGFTLNAGFTQPQSVTIRDELIHVFEELFNYMDEPIPELGITVNNFRGRSRPFKPHISSKGRQVWEKSFFVL